MELKSYLRISSYILNIYSLSILRLPLITWQS